MDNKPEIPKFYGPLAEKLLRAYLALPEKSPLRVRFERLMVAEGEGEQQVPTPDTPSGKFASMGEGEDSQDMEDDSSEEGSCCSSCGEEEGNCSCEDGGGESEDDGEGESEDNQPAKSMIVVVTPKNGTPKKTASTGKNQNRY